MESYVKAHEILHFPDSYTVIDLETTGLEPSSDFIIEVAALKIENHKEAARLETLLSCPLTVSAQTTELTGISSQMLHGAPSFSQIASKLRSFLGQEPIVGHAVLFDITFLSKAFAACGLAPLENEYIDTLPISQKLLPELVHHRLKDIAAYYKFNNDGAHRAMADCQMNFRIFEAMKRNILNLYPDYDTFITNWASLSKHLKAEMISPRTTCFDTSHPLYRKNCVITGALDRLSRREAMQAVADLGGVNIDKLNTFTDILILGNASYCDLLSGMTKKQKKALRLIDEGYPLQILSEQEFYALLPVCYFIEN